MATTSPKLSISILKGQLGAAEMEIQDLKNRISTREAQLDEANRRGDRLHDQLDGANERVAVSESALIRADRALAETVVRAERLQKELDSAIRPGDDTAVAARCCLGLLKLASPDHRNEVQIRVFFTDKGSEVRIYPSVTIFENGGRQSQEIFKSLEELEKVLRDHLKERVQYEQSKLANRIAELTNAGVLL